MKRYLAGGMLFWALIALWCGAAYALPEETSRPKYQIKMALIEEDDAQAVPRIQISMQVQVLNDSPDAWNEVWFRDYLSSMYVCHADEMDERAWRSGVVQASCEGTKLQVQSGPTEKQADETRDQSVVRVALSEPLLPGESVRIDLEYEADLPMGGMRCAYSQLDPNRSDARTYELAQFYPTLAVYEDGAWQAEPYFSGGECFYSRCADYSITLYAPEEYEVIASGRQNRVVSSEGISEWSICAGNMRDVTIVVSNELEPLSAHACGVTIRCWHAANGSKPVHDDHEAQGGIMLQAAVDAVEAFTGAYGAYPYDELDVVESAYSFGGMEAPALVRVSRMYGWFMGEDDTREDRLGAIEACRATTAHEVAHEWFYAVVGNDQYNEAWLDESMAVYSEQVYWRHTGRSEEEIAQAMKPFVEQTPAGGDLTVDRSYDELTGGLDFDYTGAVYQRGAALLYQLEQCMGRDAFQTFLKEYYAAYSFRETRTADFVALLKPYIEENQAAQTLLETYLNCAR